MPVQWQLGQQQGPDPGQRYQQAYDAGIQRQDQQALRGFQQEDREDQRAARQAQQATAALAQHRERIVYGANVIAQDRPTDDAGWQQVIGAMRQAGYDVSDVPPTFDPAYVQGVTRAAAGFPQQQNEQTTFQRDVSAAGPDYAPGTENYRRLLRNRYAPQPRVIIGPNGQPFMVTPDDDAGAQSAAPIEIENDQGQRMRLDPATRQWVPVQGGPQASRPAETFPRGGATVGNSAPVGRNLAPPSSVPANWTSGRRTPEGNRAVGGVPNSRHLSGDAADFTPRAGQNMRQLEAELRRRYPGARVVNEGDHVHVQQSGWNVPYHGRRGAGGART